MYDSMVPMYIDRVPNRNSPPAVLLRESYRQDGKVKKRTIANLSDWPDSRIEAFRAFLKGAPLSAHPEGAFEITRSRPHGHVAAALGCLRRLGLHSSLERCRSRNRDIVEAMIVARILDPRSKLATVSGLHQDTLSSSLGEVLDLDKIDEDDLYTAMDWLLPRQEKIEKSLAKRHLQEGTLVLYDLTSTWYEGHTCPLAARGYSRDGKKGTLQINFGLLCDRDGRPVAVEVFEGNTADPATLATQVDKLRKRFKLDRVVLVGDRGMITSARIREDLDPVEGLHWISALRCEQIRKLVNVGSLQLGSVRNSVYGVAVLMMKGDRICLEAPRNYGSWPMRSRDPKSPRTVRALRYEKRFSMSCWVSTGGPKTCSGQGDCSRSSPQR